MDTVFPLIPLEEAARRFVLILDAESLDYRTAIWVRRESGTSFLLVVPVDAEPAALAAFRKRVYEIRHQAFDRIPNLVDVNVSVVGPDHWAIRATQRYRNVTPDRPWPVGEIAEGWQSYEDAIVMKAA